MRVSESPALDHLLRSDFDGLCMRSQGVGFHGVGILSIRLRTVWITGCCTAAGSVVRLLAVGPQGVGPLLGQSSECWLLDHRLSSGCWVLDHRVSYRCWASRQIAGCWTTGCRQVAGCWTTGCRTAAGSVVRLLAVGPQGIVRLLGVGPQGVVPLLGQSSDCWLLDLSLIHI